MSKSITHTLPYTNNHPTTLAVIWSAHSSKPVNLKQSLLIHTSAAKKWAFVVNTMLSCVKTTLENVVSLFQHYLNLSSSDYFSRFGPREEFSDHSIL